MSVYGHSERGQSQSQDNDGLRQLERDRTSNDDKLKSRFEHIFRKYDHDFEGVGDEIDIQSGEVVVNNGHLQHMRYEADPGKGASSRFVKTFQEKLEEEDASGSSDESSEEGDEDEELESRTNDTPGTRAGSVDSFASSGLRHSLKPFSKMDRPAPRLAQLLIGEATPQQTPGATEDVESQDAMSTVSATPTPSILGQVPNLHKSVLALRAGGQEVNSDTIQALGVSIANQLAQLMAGSSKKRKRSDRERRRTESRDPVWDYPDITPTTAPKRQRTFSPLMPPPQRSSPVGASPGAESLWAPSESAQTSKRRRLGWSAQAQSSSPGIVSQKGSILPSSASRPGAAEVRRCWNCSLTRTPTWYKGPHGQYLCSSCGKYYECHRRMKPFDSPTPSVEEEDLRHVPHIVENPSLLREEDSNTAHRSEDLEVPERHDYREQLEDSTSGATQDIESPTGQDLHPEHTGNAIPERTREGHVSPTTTTHGPNAEGHPDVQQPSQPDPPDNHVQQTRAQPPGLKEAFAGNGAKTSAIARPETPETPSSPIVNSASPSGYAANTSRPMLHSPSMREKHAHYTVEEDALIIKLKERDLLSWEAIGKHFPGRSTYALQTRYSSYLRSSSSPGRQYLNALLAAVFDRPDTAADLALWHDNAWNKEQDELLFELREDKELEWNEIADLLPGHTPKAVAQRYDMLVDAAKRKRIRSSEASSAKSINDGTEYEEDAVNRRKDRFTAEEDASIVRLKEIDGLGWKEVAARFRERRLHSVQRRYSLALDPKKRKTKKTSKFDPVTGTMEDRILAVDPTLTGGVAFTQAEDDLIKRLKEQESLGWDDIAAQLPGRTSKSVQHRYEYKFSQLASDSPRTLRDEVASRLSVTRQESSTPAVREAPRPGPGARRPFTQEEDALIIRLKEKEDSSWEKIAEQLPSRSVNSVSSRYHEVLRPSRTVPTPNESPSNGDNSARSSPAKRSPNSFRDIVHLRDSATSDRGLSAAQYSEPVHLLRYTPEEDSLIISLREQGLSWKDIAAQLPGRTPGSVQNHFSTKLKFIARQSLPTMAISQRNDSPLLRKAIGNRLRRRTIHNPFSQSRSAQEGFVELDNDDSVASVVFGSNASANDQQAKQASEPKDESPADLSHQNVDEDTVSTPTEGDDIPPVSAVASDLQMFESVLQVATRYAVDRSYPTLLARIQEIYNQDQNDPRLHRLLEVASGSSASASEVLASLEHAVNASPESSKCATRSLQAALAPEAEAEPMDSAGSEDESFEQNAQTLMDAFEPDDISRSTTVKRSEKIDKVPTSRNTRGSRRRRSSPNEPLFMTPEGTPPPLDTQVSPSSAGQQSPEVDLASPARPELSFSQLVRTAFEANARPMQCQDIYDWVETNFEFYRLSPPSWKARVRAELSANPSFERTITTGGENAWQLIEGVDTEPWGITRGPRRKCGVPPMSNEADVSLTTISTGDDQIESMEGDTTAGASPDGPEEQITQTMHLDEEQREPALAEPAIPTDSSTAKRRVQPKRLQAAKPDLDAQNTASYRIVPKARGRPRKKAAQKPTEKCARQQKSQKPKQRANRQIVDLTQMDDELSSDAALPDQKPASSSSPPFVKPATPGRVFGRRSSLRKSMGSPLPVFVQRSAPLANVRRSSGLARFMETPVREVDSDEDELA